MKKNKKKIIIIGSIIAFLLILLLSIFLVRSLRNENSLSLNENRWIDSNKQNVYDISVMNDIPVLSYDGNGLVFDFLNYITANTDIKLNIVTYKLDGTSNYDYKLELVNAPTENNIVLLKDNFIIITKDNISYNSLEDIKDLKLGVTKIDLSVVEDYFSDNNIEFVNYENYTDLKKSLTDEAAENTVIPDGIIIPKTIFTKEIIEDDHIVSYQFDDLNKYYVLTLNGPNELNSILKKKYNIWQEKNYKESYNNNLLNDYFDFEKISDVEQKVLKSKSYVYGFIDYGMYNYLSKNKISGLNSLILKGFNEFSNVSITYTKYSSISKLVKDFNENKVDFTLNIINNSNYTANTLETSGVFDKKLVIISGKESTSPIVSLKSLKDHTVLTIKDSYVEQLLIDNKAKIKSYNNMSDLTRAFGSRDIAIVDLENYNYYKTSAFKDAKIDYLIDFDDKYSYIVNDNLNNTTFENLFDFYCQYISINELVSKNYSSIAYENINIVLILVLIIIILSMYVIIDFYNHFKNMVKIFNKNKRIHLSKGDKMKYIDQLTSLKNRAYLNSKIESWDESEIYPQSVIIIDLNNISYINDNYGREEGDKVITEAANILIQNQLQNSEIIRTDGNEFLIYLVGYNEKQIVSYLRKLNKELKTLSHGFGSASGYSIINDAIKTFDDAVNEATLDMKNNKEDIEY